MNKLVIFISLLVFSFSGMAQRDGYSPQEYKERYLNKRARLMHSSTKQFTPEEQKELDDILSDLDKLHPDSYEYRVLSYINSGYHKDFEDELLEAYKMNPADELVIKQMLAYHIINGNTAKAIEFVKKVDDFYSKNEWDYYRDLILTVKKGFVITGGQDDTYPLLAAKMLYGIGADVNVICLDFLQNDTYRKNIEQTTGMPATPFLGKEKFFISVLLKNSKEKVVISTTVDQNYLKQVETNIFITGLVYEYNCPDQRKALEEFWMTSQAKKIDQISLGSSTDRKLYTNYIPPLLTLYRLKHYAQQEDPLLKKMIQAWAVKVKREDTIAKILEEYESD